MVMNDKARNLPLENIRTLEHSFARRSCREVGMRTGPGYFLAGPTLLFFCASACAQDYSFPVPFQRFNADLFTILNVPAGETTYGITVDLSQTVVEPTFAMAGPVAASFMYYVRPKPLPSVRYEFRIDASALTGATLTGRSFQLFAASSPVIVSNWPQLLTIELVGDTPYPALRLTTPRGNKPVEQVTVPLPSSSSMVRVEINVGAGASGIVRYWIDADYIDSPTGILDDGGAGLDNEAWSGVIAAAVGLSSTTSDFRANCGGTFVVDHLGSSDDVLFWDKFDFGYQ